jgi:transcriptional regulator with XRE-family HTH domain
MNYIQECLALNLKNRRAYLGLTQEKLAEIADLSSGYIAGMETGKGWPSAESLAKLSRALKVDHWKLLVDPRKDEVGLTREEFAMIMDKWKNDILDNTPPSYPPQRRLLDGERGGESDRD